MGRSKYKAEDKIRIVKACIAGEIRQTEASERIGADESMVRDWIRQYQTEGVAAFLPRTENRRYAPELKESAVKDYLAGEGSLRQICKKYNISSLNATFFINLKHLVSKHSVYKAIFTLLYIFPKMLSSDASKNLQKNHC